jgi:NADH-quinone oxidoreductase subunit J
MAELVFFVIVGIVGVVAQRNVLYSGLFLILDFLCLAALYILMSAQFVGVAQIIVYAGAVMVLFLFTVMLIAGKRTEATGGLPGQRLLAALVVIALGAELYLLLAGRLPGMAAVAGPALSPNNVQAVAEALFGRYLWAFEATGLLFLVALVGVVYLVRGGAGQGERG